MRQDLPKASFTNKNIAAATPGRHQITGAKGLYLYVAPGGDVRRWIYRFTSPATKRVTETGLGLWPVVALTDAKAKADGLRKQVALGECPIHAKRAERANATITFKEACDGWIETHKPSWKGGDNSSQMKNATLLLHLHGAPLARVPVASITPDQVQAVLKQLWERSPLQGRRALNMWERVFDFAKAKGWMQGQNPCEWKGLMQYRFPRGRKGDKGHYEALPYEQLPTFMRQLRQRQERSTGAVALEFLILTCARSGEVLGAQWDQIDWDKKLWTLSAEQTKQGREHVVPLSDRAMQLLTLQRQYANGSPFIFTGYRKTRMADKAMNSVLSLMDVQASCHGFRSSFRDYCGNETNFAREPVEHCLAHRLGNSVELAYRRQDSLNKRRVIMAAWADFCNGDASRAQREAA